MSGWDPVPLANLLDVQNGYAFSSEQFSEQDGVPLIRIRDLKRNESPPVRFSGAYEERYLVNNGDLLIGMDGEFICYEWAGGRALLNQRVCRLINFSNRVEPRFLLYGINKFLKKIEDATAYTTVKHLSSKTIKEIAFPLPPLDVQRRVVAVLDQAFAALDRARTNADAGLIDAKELRDSIVASSLEKALDADSKRIRLGELCSIVRGGSPRPIQKFLTDDPEGLNWIKISDATASGMFIEVTRQKISKEGMSRSRYVTPGSFLLTNSMSFGRPYILKIDGCIHDGWLALEPNYKFVEQEYLYYLLGSKQVYNEFDRLAAGSTVRNLNIDLVSNVYVSLPSLDRQREAVARIAGALRTTEEVFGAYQHQCSENIALRQSLLQAAFSGQLN